MARGGARARSGPPPDPEALRRDRRDDKAGWVTLPPEGRKGRAPSWPLVEASSREADLWKREWKRPQAVEWERNNLHVEVALYVRALAEAEQPDASIGVRDLVRKVQENLGLSLPGLARNRWKIGAAEAPASKQPRRIAKQSSVKDRFQVIDGGGS